MRSVFTSFVLLNAVSVLAQQRVWDQCGGKDYAGPRSCVSGSSCNFVNEYYSQCQPSSQSSPGQSSTATPPAKVYEQCGGRGWTGKTTCETGTSCQFVNEYYSQCQPTPTSTSFSTTRAISMSTPTSTSKSKSSLTSSLTPTSVAASTSSSRPTTTPGGATPWWFGINLSGAEFGSNIPGVYNQDYIWYDKGHIDILIAQGFNHFRVNFLMERLTPSGLTGRFDSNYLGNLTDQINYITSRGVYAMIQPHNYGRFYNNIITDVSGFKTWWQNVAALFKNNQFVTFDTNNEFHDMDQQLVFNLNQAAIDGIRGAGALTQWITPEGNSWTGAWTWISSGNGASLIKLRDPQNKLIFQMHQYLDSDGSGTNAGCVSATVFRDRLQAATKWLRDNKQLGIIGEYAGSNSPVCIAALQDGLSYMKANADVWTGSMWWAAGPWWHNGVFYDMEPPSGVAFRDILPKIAPYGRA